MNRVRSKSINVLLTILVAVIALSAGFAWLTRARSLPTASPDGNETQAAATATTDPKGVFADKPVADCRTVELPRPGAEINTVLDYYSKTLMISFLDPRLGEDRRFYIRHEDPACQQNPALKVIIDDAMVGMCRSMADIARGGRPDGRTQAAKRYLERWCR